MAWYDENSQFNFGKHKGETVKDVDDSNYISWLHHNRMNVYFTDEVLNRLNVENRGKRRLTKNSKRLDK